MAFPTVNAASKALSRVMDVPPESPHISDIQDSLPQKDLYLNKVREQDF